MWVAENDVERVLDWFYRESEAHFLGVFVAGDKEFDKLLGAVLADRQTIDIVTGHCIDLVLFSTRNVGPEQGSAQIQHISQLAKWTPQVRRDISTGTAMSTNEIATAMRLEVDDLPGLVLLRRRAQHQDTKSERLVLRLRNATDVEFLIEFLRAFRRSLERIEKSRSEGLRLAEGTLAKIERVVTNHIQETAVIGVRDQRIARCAAEVCDSLPLASVDSEQLHAVLRSSSGEELVAKLSELSGGEPQQIEAAIPADTLRRLRKAQIARRNAENRLAKLDLQLPAALDFAQLTEQEFAELQAVLDRFSKQLSYNLTRAQVFRFLGASEKVLSHVKRIVRLAVAIKSGGASLL